MTERRCARCGKIFIPAYYHAYKEYGKVYCSWSCYNHRHEKPPQSGFRKGKRIDMYDEDGRLVASFEDAHAVERDMGCAANNIRNACRTKKRYKGFYWKYRDQGEDAE